MGAFRLWNIFAVFGLLMGTNNAMGQDFQSVRNLAHNVHLPAATGEGNGVFQHPALPHYLKGWTAVLNQSNLSWGTDLKQWGFLLMYTPSSAIGNLWWDDPDYVLGKGKRSNSPFRGNIEKNHPHGTRFLLGWQQRSGAFLQAGIVEVGISKWLAGHFQIASSIGLNYYTGLETRHYLPNYRLSIYWEPSTGIGLAATLENPVGYKMKNVQPITALIHSVYLKIAPQVFVCGAAQIEAGSPHEFMGAIYFLPSPSVQFGIKVLPQYAMSLSAIFSVKNFKIGCAVGYHSFLGFQTENSISWGRFEQYRTTLAPSFH